MVSDSTEQPYVHTKHLWSEQICAAVEDGPLKPMMQRMCIAGECGAVKYTWHRDIELITGTTLAGDPLTQAQNLTDFVKKVK